jgi:tetratricopeptide (TPR) repeat protein
MKQQGLLLIDLMTNSAQFSGVKLEISEREVHFLWLLATRTFQKTTFSGLQQTIGIEDIRALEQFRSANPKNLGTQLARFVRELTVPIVKSPEGKTKIAYYLCADTVKRIEYQQEDTSARVIATVFDSQMTTQWAKLAFCEALNEAGFWREARIELQNFIPTVSSSLLARVRLALAESWFLEGSMREVQENLEAVQFALDVEPDLTVTGLTKVLKVRVLWAMGDFQLAETQVRSLLGETNPAIKARLENLLGVIMLDQNAQASKVEEHFQAALRFAYEARWWWGVQAALSNLGLMAFYEALKPKALTLTWVTRANDWFEAALGFAQKIGYGHANPQLYIRAAMIKNALGFPEQARVLLEQARITAKRPFDLAWAQAELDYCLEILGIKSELPNQFELSSSEELFLQRLPQQRIQLNDSSQS